MYVFIVLPGASEGPHVSTRAFVDLPEKIPTFFAPLVKFSDSVTQSWLWS